MTRDEFHMRLLNLLNEAANADIAIERISVNYSSRFDATVRVTSVDYEVLEPFPEKYIKDEV